MGRDKTLPKFPTLPLERERDRETERQTERQRQRDRERDRERELIRVCFHSNVPCMSVSIPN